MDVLDEVELDIDPLSLKKRSIRRHQKQRMKQKAKRIAWVNGSNFWTLMVSLYGDSYAKRRKEYEEGYIRNADNLCMCSCHSCRNQRHSRWCKGKNKLTIQEIKSRIIDGYEDSEEEAWIERTKNG